MIRVPLVLGCIGLMFGCGDQDVVPPQPTKMVVAVGLQPSSALLLVAEGSGHFAEHHLAINVVGRPSGKLAMSAVAVGEIDADFIFLSDIAYLGHQHLIPDYRVAATVFDSDNVNAIASLGNFQGLADMKGKTLCTQYLSALHFFGQILTERSGIDNVTFRYFNVAELNEKLISGDCDFITTREPMISNLMAEVNRPVNVRSYPGVYLQYELMLVHNRVDNKELEQFLKVLIKTETFIQQQTVFAERILMNRLNTDADKLHNIFVDSVLEVSLYQPLLPLLEREREWLQSHGVEQAGRVALHEMLRAEPLKKVAPLRQTIVDYEN
ncbi:ABC transporter substrate-binding protein [Vibrio mediterranei]|uniref:ABC transporter substrate-binding protein n=1 Tax=Vibrio mediterranei TaxID=689 RepID=UPI004067F9CE